MKQTTKLWIGMTILAFASSAVTGAVIKNTKTNEAPAPIFAPSPAAAAAVSGGYVDLTSAAESAVNAVVYIKVTQTGKTQRVTVQDPFSDFFGDFFGFGGRGQQPQQREYKAPDRHGAGSGAVVALIPHHEVAPLGTFCPYVGHLGRIATVAMTAFAEDDDLFVFDKICQ